MLHINDITYRIEGRLLLDRASAAIPAGHKVGVVGRNGAGKTTLLRLIAGEIAPDGGSVAMPRRTRIGQVAQEAPGGPQSLIETVLAADTERASLLAESATATDPARIADIHVRLGDIGAHAAPARAAAILAGLGFPEAEQQRPCAALSGGWRMRVALAAALFAAPDILLLDEPSNYLDLEGTLWLEAYLRSYPHTFLLVSHDRDLLNNAVDHILYLNEARLSLYAGGYDRFEAARAEQQRLELKLKKSQDEERRRIQAFVDRFRAKATKARQAQSRLKLLEKMQPVAAQIDRRVAPFSFPDPARPLGNPLLRLEGAAAGYAPGRPVLANLDLRIDQDDRIGLLGANGNGKSTFAKLLCGRLEPTAGRMRCSNKLAVGYFAQHQLDELNPGLSPYDHIAELMPDATEAQKRARLGHLGFGADTADSPAGVLSGGEKARLLFALAAFHGPHLLILDEPTNHLDVDSREMLIRALNDYAGAVILISHDRHLIEATADRLWIVRDGTVRAYEGDLAAYRAECLAERRLARGAAATDAPKGAGRQAERRESAARRADMAPLRRRIERHEAMIERIGRQIAKLDERLADGATYASGGARVEEIARARGELVKALAEVEDAWVKASQAYEETRE